MTYGPGKMPVSIVFANQTTYSAIYNSAGMPTTVSLTGAARRSTTPATSTMARGIS